MTINTILVLLKHPRPQGLLKIASELAHASGAELKALYMENQEWFQASNFSFSQQITGFRGEILPLSEHQITEQSRALAARFKKVFTSYSQSLNIKYSYHTIQTHTDHDFENAITGVDLVLMTGKSQSMEFWIRATARHATPLLIWNNNSSLLKEIIGLCITPEQSFEIVQWTIHLGDLLNRKSRLFWSKQFDVNDEWINKLTENNSKAAPLISRKVNQISEIQPILSTDTLQYFRNALFIVRRQDLEIDIDTFHQKTPISVLLL